MSIIIPIITEYFDGGVNKAQKSLKSLVASNLSATVAVTALVGASTKAVKAFNEDAKSQQLLALTLRNTTNATAQQISATEDYLSALSMEAAIADDELRPALSNLLRITQDQTVSQTLLNDALNIAATTSRPLSDVTMALGKAYQGNFKALRSMGFAISDSTMKSKDFDSAMREIRPVIEGASEEAANSAEGGFAKLKIAFDELTESAGGALSPIVEDLATITTSLVSKTKDAEGETNAWGMAIGTLIREVIPGVKALEQFSFVTDKLATSIENSERAASSAAQFRMAENKTWAQYQRSLLAAKDASDKLTTSTNKTKTAAQKLADTARTNLKNALENAKQRVTDLKEEASNLAGTLRDQVSGFVSLSDAVSTASTSEDVYNQALKDRAEAYSKLNALEAERQRRGFGANDQVTYDAQEYAQALLDVASAETAVSNAQSSRVDYSAKFAADIAAASQFAGNLKTLVSQGGLSQAGVQQLLNLGPVAGNQVALDLLSGVGAMTVTSLNNSLAGLASVGQGLGDVTATGVFGAAIAGAQGDVDALGNARVGTVNNNVTIQVSGTDPQAVVDALKKWMKTNGSIPIRVKG